MKVVLIQVKGDCSTNAICSMKTWRDVMNKPTSLYLSTIIVSGKVEENISATDNHVSVMSLYSVSRLGLY